MIWPFRRKPKPPLPHVGPKTVDWKPGDMAECISSNWPMTADLEIGPKVGERLMVTSVIYGPDVFGFMQGFGLMFVGYRRWAYDALAFRKTVLTDTGADRTVTKKAPRRRTKEPA